MSLESAFAFVRKFVTSLLAASIFLLFNSYFIIYFRRAEYTLLSHSAKS